MSSQGEDGGAERARALADALARRGIRVRVEPSDRLAVLVPDPGPAVDWPSVRADVVACARDHGFTHVALEVDG